MNQPDSEILTLDEVAVYLKAGKKTVYRPSRGRHRDSNWAVPGGFVAASWIVESLDCRADAEKIQDKT